MSASNGAGDMIGLWFSLPPVLLRVQSDLIGSVVL